MTVRELLRQIQSRLSESGCGDREGEILLCHVLDCGRLFLFTNGTAEITEEQKKKALEMMRRRTTGEPLQYILGSAPFMGLDIKVNENVLIPRPETELTAKLAFDYLSCSPSAKVLDLCTGSGCLAACIALNFPQADVTAADISEKALAVAALNCPSGVTLVCSDLFEKIGDTFDLIVTNPPYISPEEIETLSSEVKDHEPRLALDGGKEGLELIGRILKEVPGHLRAGGLLLMETGYDQGAAARRLAEEAGLKHIETLKDLNGLDRILYAQK